MKMLHHKNTPTFDYLITSLVVVASLSVNELLTVEKMIIVPQTFYSRRLKIILKIVIFTELKIFRKL